MSEETDDKKPQHIPGSELRNTRMSSVGMPAEKSENFAATSKRLGRLMAGEMLMVVCILVLAIVSVFLVVIGPKVLGHATDILFDGLLKREGRDGVALFFLRSSSTFSLSFFPICRRSCLLEWFREPCSLCGRQLRRRFIVSH